MGDAKTIEVSSRAAISRARLFEVASSQGGYFTTEQARECGISRALLAHHVKSGRFIRVRRGLYRFREYPPSPREEVLAAWLALGRDRVVVSHESALDLLELSDVVPTKVHMTVPRSRRHLPSLPGVKIHTSSKPFHREDLVVRDGISVTSATRSIIDSAESGTAPEQVEMAVAQAITRGQATRDQLRVRSAERSRRVATLISRALDRALV